MAMVAEVTAGRPDQDRIAKRHCYARAGIPLHLLIDRDKSQVSVFGKPQRDECTEVRLAPFGESLAPPDPFGFELDTKPFLRAVGPAGGGQPRVAIARRKKVRLAGRSASRRMK
ncbi:Uma2 family endonuclease [Kitasatospora indigofera]|uniref:Uma2 family endonuclease n=1 Tax=Kitasatospora indigofera TaxID=67307 RepID=UPI003570C775